MSKKRVRASSSMSAKKKATSKNCVVTNVNYIKGTRKGKKGTYSVTTKKRKK